MTTFREYARANGIEIVPHESNDEMGGAIRSFYLLSKHAISEGRRNGTPMQLEVEFIDAPGFNAFASSLGQTDVIAIFKDVLPITLSVARAMASCAELLPRVATAGIQTDQVKLDASGSDLPALTAKWVVGALADPLREKLAQNIAAVTIAYILQHELAHICNGHIDYIGLRSGLALLAEMSGQGLPSPSDFERETLEWDADTRALQIILEMVLQPAVHKVDGRGVWDIPAMNDFGTLLGGLTIALCAASMCATIFAIGDAEDPLDKRPRSHPHPWFRLISSQSFALHVLAFRTGRPYDDWSDIVKVACDESAQSLRQTLSLKRNLPVGKLHKAYKSRLRAWEECWSDLHAKLDPLKRGGVLAPAHQTAHPAFPKNAVIG